MSVQRRFRGKQLFFIWGLVGLLIVLLPSVAIGQTHLTLTFPAQVAQDKSIEGDRLQQQGQHQLYSGQLQSSLESFQQALEHHRASGNRSGEAAALTGIAETSASVQKATESLKAAQEALVIFQDLQDQAGEAETLHLVGVAYAMLKQVEPATEYLQKSLDLRRAIKDRQGEGWTLGHIGLGKCAQEQVEAGLAMLEQSLGILNESVDTPEKALKQQYRKLIISRILGFAYQEQKRFEQAKEAFLQSLVTSRILKNYPLENDTLTLLSKIALEQKQYALALDYYRQSLISAKQLDNRLSELAVQTTLSDLENILAQANTFISEGLYSEALEIFQQSRVPLQEAFTLAQALSNSQLESTAQEYLIVSYVGSGQVYDRLEQFPEAITAAEKALAISLQADRKDLQLLALRDLTSSHSNFGRQLSEAGEFERALAEFDKKLKFGLQGLEIAEQMQDPEQFKIIRSIIASAYNDKATFYFEPQQRYSEALELYQKELIYLKEIEDLPRELTSLMSLSSLNSLLGNFSEALSLGNQALEMLHQMPERFPRQNLDKPGLLVQIGAIYNEIGKPEVAVKKYEEALSLAEQHGSLKFQAVAFNSLGSVKLQEAQYDEAKQDFNRALKRFRKIRRRLQLADYQAHIMELCSEGDPIWREHNLSGAQRDANNRVAEYSRELCLQNSWNGEATLLNNLGIIYGKQERYDEELASYQQSLKIIRDLGDKRKEAITLNNIAWYYYEQKNPADAIAQYQKALNIQRSIGVRPEQIRTLYGLALAYRSKKDLKVALETVNEAIGIIEDLRIKIVSDDFRTSYFATVQDYYQLKIDLLMQLGEEEEAFNTSERSHTRTLVELLTESGVTSQESTNNPELKALYKKKEDMEGQLAAFENLLRNPRDEEDRNHIQREYEAVEAELKERVEPEIKQKDPVYASIQYPTPLTLPQVQQYIADMDTILLQYSIGEAQSYLWLISKPGTISSTGLSSYTLKAGREQVQEAVQNFRRTISIVTCSDPAQACNLQEKLEIGANLNSLILPTEAAQKIMGKKRLIVVPDSTLHTIPFSALPIPYSINAKTYVPLITKHDIVNEPSASSLHSLRQQMSQQRQQQRRPAAKTLAVVADPVFGGSDDVRMNSILNHRSTNPTTFPELPSHRDEAALTQALRRTQLNQSPEMQLPLPPRLERTGITAKTILNLVSNPAQKTSAFGFAANQDWLAQSKLDQYRLLLFATHGIFDETAPKQSGIVLSLVNDQGNLQDGYLTLREIFNLKLSADLLILSACESGLGERIRGEGMVGITRGFMYAGAERIVASLWDISAELETNDFLVTYFTKMLPTNGSSPFSPTEAFQATQREMAEKYPDPYYWAAFTLQGEWQG
jgi:CHAT domain-containing protein/tetratricopeptide (TPR) repeat protein